MSIGVQGNNGTGGWCYISQVGTDTRKDLYGVSVGASSKSSTRFSSSGTALGITTDGEKSGMVVDLSESLINSIQLGTWIIKYI